MQIDVPLAMEDIDAGLVKVRVDLDLVNGGFDPAASDDISELWQNTVADTD